MTGWVGKSVSLLYRTDSWCS